MSLGGGGCSERRSCYWTPDWTTEQDSVSKEKKEMKRTNNSVGKWSQKKKVKKREKQMALKHIKRCSISCIKREMRYHLSPMH